MSQLNFTQKVAKVIGKKAGPNTWFGPDTSDPDNQSVYTSIKPMKSSKSLGCVTASDLPRIAKAHIQSFCK